MQAKPDMGKLHTQPELAAQLRMVDDGSGKVEVRAPAWGWQCAYKEREPLTGVKWGAGGQAWKPSALEERISGVQGQSDCMRHCLNNKNDPGTCGAHPPTTRDVFKEIETYMPTLQQLLIQSSQVMQHHGHSLTDTQLDNTWTRHHALSVANTQVHGHSNHSP